MPRDPLTLSPDDTTAALAELWGVTPEQVTQAGHRIPRDGHGFYQRPNLQWSKANNRGTRRRLFIAADFTRLSAATDPTTPSFPPTTQARPPWAVSSSTTSSPWPAADPSATTTTSRCCAPPATARRADH